MLRNEALWIGAALSKLPAGELSPILNIGSANREFREKLQPWIDAEILAPLRARSVTVQHHDFREDDGIDIAGDLADELLWERFRQRGFRTLLCCNVLEHVADRVILCRRIEDLAPRGGHILITVPNRFPYHPDPIDTMFRPELSDVADLFPNCRMIQGAIIDCGTGWDYVGNSVSGLISRTMHRLRGMKQHGGVQGSSSFVPWLFRHFRQTCILLQK